MKYNILKIFAFTLLFTACNDELKINADWKDVAVVYGILDKIEDTNYIRIHRAYLGTEGIEGGNQDPDSLYYPSLQVSIRQMNGQDVVKTFALVKDESVELQDGFFTGKDYHVYRLVHQLDNQYSYQLYIDKESDELDPVYSTTPLVGDFSFIKPPNNPLATLGYYPRGQEVKWNTAKEGRLYQTIVRFKYTEADVDNWADSTSHYVDYVLADATASKLDGSQTFTRNIDGDSYYRYLYDRIGVNHDVIRFYRGTDIYIAAAADDFATYMNVNSPSTGVIQDKPSFTNISGGDGVNAGIFSSRNWAIREALDFNDRSWDSLVKGNITCELQFAYLFGIDTCHCAVNANQVCF